MTVLSFDIASGGVSAAIFSATAEIVRRAERPWHFTASDSGGATLSISTVLEQFKVVVQDLNVPASVNAIVIGCFMHNCVLLDADDQPLTPVFTWLDQRGVEGVQYVRRRVGDAFHEWTGCRYHPMFPVFKLASLFVRNSGLIARTKRVVTVKAFLIHRLTEHWIEDHGMASSSGLFNLTGNIWDPTLVSLVGLKPEQLPDVTTRTDIAGHVTAEAAAEFGLAKGAGVVVGSGDGFLATVGSECEQSLRIAVTLGTSAVARQTVSKPILNLSSGTFCYKADRNKFLLGCASNNGGNTLDWGRAIFGEPDAGQHAEDLPLFIPLLHGERSPEWDPGLTASFHRLKAQHGLAHMARSVLEGVLFNLAWLVEILQETSGQTASEIVLSGNGFLAPGAPRILASVLNQPVLMPSDPGEASLRGAALCALLALGHAVSPLGVQRVAAFDDPHLAGRYQRYKELRRRL